MLLAPRNHIFIATLRLSFGSKLYVFYRRGCVFCFGLFAWWSEFVFSFLRFMHICYLKFKIIQLVVSEFFFFSVLLQRLSLWLIYVNWIFYLVWILKKIRAWRIREFHNIFSDTFFKLKLVPLTKLTCQSYSVKPRRLLLI